MSLVSGPALGQPTQFVSNAASKRVLSWKEMIARLSDAYGVAHSHAAHPRRVLTRGEGTWLRAMPAAPSNSRYMGAKLFGGGRNKGVHYLIALFDQETGAIAGLVDGNYVTACRTGATTAMAIDRLAPAGPAVLGILGSGTEAQSHLRAIAAVRPLSEVRVFSPSGERRTAFAAGMESELQVRCVPVDRPEAVADGATILLAAARSHGEKPILFGHWLREGMLVASIGSTVPDQREIDVSVVEACDLIVCDAVEEVSVETGDMLQAKAEGIEFDHKLASLNDLVAGKLEERIRAARICAFKSVGAAVQDITIAELALERATAEGLATTLPVEFTRKGH